MTNTIFVNIIRPELARCFGSGRLNNLFSHLSPLGLCPKTEPVTADSIAWLLCALIFCRSTESGKISAWAKAMGRQWEGDELSPLSIFRGLLSTPHAARLITAIVANRTTGIVTAFCADDSEISSDENRPTTFAEVVAIDPLFITWCADKLLEVEKAELKTTLN